MQSGILSNFMLCHIVCHKFVIVINIIVVTVIVINYLHRIVVIIITLWRQNCIVAGSKGLPGFPGFTGRVGPKGDLGRPGGDGTSGRPVRIQCNFYWNLISLFVVC